ncbi:VanZ family protein [Rehaibacterium terrae]|jgi:VanZ family protein|uniref:VanZ family protein n=1 Tax=Rehaibacterium terrae TaxID=1341696 RepID=A0A7W7V7M1_9GAMM|nr:VanZ family protein [Rehaibacterium terrae]MBB5014703.1 VanZ family protein [Rehaibacterium terrae]
MRALRRPRLWLALWLAMVATVIVVSLAPPPPVPQAIPGSDKLGHVLAYFLLMAGAVQLFASRAALLAIAVWLAALGLGLEFAQGALTASRRFELLDALANTAGVLAGLALAHTPAARWLQRFDGWWR